MMFRAAFFIWPTFLAYSPPAFAQNPLITHQFTADPSARVFGDRVYVYPSHDIRATAGHGSAGWFNMADYHVFSSSNLTDWTDHGVIVSQDRVKWVRPSAYAMWAPDCIEHAGKYYFYFPAPVTRAYGSGFKIGVAVADKPEGPFTPQEKPILNTHGIDPNVFIDRDGQAYLLWADGNIMGAKLKDNMLELATQPQALGALPHRGLIEGPFLFERNGIYYLTYPHTAGKTERLEYAMGTSPLGPFKYAGVLMEARSECSTNHQSVIEFKGQWYLFYHRNDLSPHFDKNRSIMADRMEFNPDGTIVPVVSTLRGVGITRADREIQIDRYSDMAKTGVTVDFVDKTQPFLGWKTHFTQEGAWIRYNEVEFGKKHWNAVSVQGTSTAHAILEIHLNSLDGALVARARLARSQALRLTKTQLLNVPRGKHDLFFVLKSQGAASVDWIKFE